MYAGNQIGLIKKVVHALSFTRLVPERSGTEPERFISSLLWNSISKLLRNFWFSYNQLWLQRCWWQWYVVGLIIWTAFRCWWQNQTNGDFYCNVVTQCDEKVINILYSSSITHICHQHLPSPTSVTNIKKTQFCLVQTESWPNSEVAGVGTCPMMNATEVFRIIKNLKVAGVFETSRCFLLETWHQMHFLFKL